MKPFKTGDKVTILGSAQVYKVEGIQTTTGKARLVTCRPAPSFQSRMNVSLTILEHYEENTMSTRAQHIKRLKDEILLLEKLEKLESEQMDYDPKQWMPDRNQNYFILENWKVDIEECVNIEEKHAHTHKEKGLGYLFKTYEHAQKFVEELE